MPVEGGHEGDVWYLRRTRYEGIDYLRGNCGISELGYHGRHPFSGKVLNMCPDLFDHPISMIYAVQPARALMAVGGRE